MPHNLKDFNKIYVIIPAYNESLSIGRVIADIPVIANLVIVVDNGSTDNTHEIAENAGAVVLLETRKGYGFACLKGIEYLKSQANDNDIIVFMDADYSDFPEDLSSLTAPVKNEKAELVIGSRVLGQRERGALLIQQRIGNWIATKLIHLFFNVKFTDLGPFRAIRWDKLIELNMQDKTFGWTVEMQVKAAKQKLKCLEVPVRYRKRIGISKVSGTVYGSFMAAWKILYTIFKSI